MTMEAAQNDIAHPERSEGTPRIVILNRPTKEAVVKERPPRKGRFFASPRMTMQAAQNDNGGGSE